MFELYALDIKLDVKPTADAFETRANVMKAIQGHILGKAVYGGLFKRRHSGVINIRGWPQPTTKHLGRARSACG